MRLYRRRLLIVLAATAAWLRALPASAQAWPSRPIRLIVPFPAGGSAHLSARLLADHLKTALGQPVVVESKVGAGGNIAAAEAAHAEPNGYTLFIGTNGTQTINQSLYRNLTYDPPADFASIAMMWEAPHLLVVHASVPADKLQAFIAYAKANPGKLNYGSSGIGSSTHLFGEVFKARTGIEMTHVPYRGQGPALTDLVGGRLQAMFPIVPDVISYLRAGTLRALALASAKPSSVLPDVRGMPQVGYPDLTASAWVGLYAPAKTPDSIVQRLRQEVAALLRGQSFVERMKQVGIEVQRMTPEEFEGFMREERARWGQVVQSLELKID
jgi:tripartite-type tricarboxylate transporter receptor subunit TctC